MKKILVILLLLYPGLLSAGYFLIPDFDNDGSLGIAEAIAILEVLADIEVVVPQDTSAIGIADINDDSRFSMEEAIYILQIASGNRQQPLCSSEELGICADRISCETAGGIWIDGFCEDKQNCDAILFDNSPLAYEDFVAIVPLGNFNPPGHTLPSDHVYFYLSDPATEYSVISPGNITIIEVRSVEHLSESPVFIDYDIIFKQTLCNSRRFRFGHLSSLSQNILSEIDLDNSTCTTYSTGGKIFKSCRLEGLKIDLYSGDSVGTAGGNFDQNALDFFAYDFSIKNGYANPQRYENTHLPYAACPLNYYSSDTKTVLVSMLGDSAGNVLRTIQPLCGEVEQDVPSTAQGNWFPLGFSGVYPEDTHLTLAHDNVDPTTPIFSVGTSIPGIATGKYSYEPGNNGEINREFANIISDGKIYCYELEYTDGYRVPSTIVLIKLLDENTLRIEKQTADSCNPPYYFESSYADFVR